MKPLERADQLQVERLRQRADFLAAARATSIATTGVVLQARDRKDEGQPRVGFTVTKKLGNAVTRNRIKRRLREAARLSLVPQARRGFDYVLIGRAAGLRRPFASLQNDITAALKRLDLPPTSQG